MIDQTDDVTTWRFHRVSGLAVIGSALLHATALAALLPETLPRQERLSEQAIELTLERPTGPLEAPRLTPGPPFPAIRFRAASVVPPIVVLGAPLTRTPLSPFATAVVPSAASPT